jgi:hypothetical protein
MANYVYVCWLRDNTSQTDEQDHEWPAVILIEAASGTAALAWGDHLAKDYCLRHVGSEFLRSLLDPDQSGVELLPRVTCGDEVPDEVIGW